MSGDNRITILSGLVLLVLTLTQPVVGQTYKWVDKEGNVSYQDQPPPDNARAIERLKHNDNRPDSSNQNLPKLVLYSLPVCDSCDLVRQYLEKRSISFSEKKC